MNAGKSKTSEDQAVCVEDSLAKVKDSPALKVQSREVFWSGFPPQTAPPGPSRDVLGLLWFFCFFTELPDLYFSLFNFIALQNSLDPYVMCRVWNMWYLRCTMDTVEMEPRWSWPRNCTLSYTRYRIRPIYSPPKIMNGRWMSVLQPLSRGIGLVCPS